jgi:hypothetical protein
LEKCNRHTVLSSLCKFGRHFGRTSLTYDNVASWICVCCSCLTMLRYFDSISLNVQNECCHPIRMTYPLTDCRRFVDTKNVFYDNTRFAFPGCSFRLCCNCIYSSLYRLRQACTSTGLTFLYAQSQSVFTNTEKILSDSIHGVATGACSQICFLPPTGIIYCPWRNGWIAISVLEVHL